MDFAALHRSNSGGGFGERAGHETKILKHSYSEGSVKVYVDDTGHAQKTEITIPEGKVVVIKDYEKVPMLAQYRRVEMYSPDDEFIDSLDIFAEDRMSGNSNLRFFSGKYPIGTGMGDIGMIIAHKLTGTSLSLENVGTSSIDPEVITQIKQYFKHSTR
jgi:hypothetical protein